MLEGILLYLILSTVYIINGLITINYCEYKQYITCDKYQYFNSVLLWPITVILIFLAQYIK